MGNCVAATGHYAAEALGIRNDEEKAKVRFMKTYLRKMDEYFIQSFARSFAQENTNDRAEIMSESTAAMIIVEWIRFMAISWY